MQCLDLGEPVQLFLLDCANNVVDVLERKPAVCSPQLYLHRTGWSAWVIVIVDLACDTVLQD